MAWVNGRNPSEKEWSIRLGFADPAYFDLKSDLAIRSFIIVDVSHTFSFKIANF